MQRPAFTVYLRSALIVAAMAVSAALWGFSAQAQTGSAVAADAAAAAPPPPIGFPTGPRSPHTPVQATRPAGWPGTPVPSYRAANGDTVIGALPSGEVMISDERGPATPGQPQWTPPPSRRPIGPIESPPSPTADAWRRPGPAVAVDPPAITAPITVVAPPAVNPLPPIPRTAAVATVPAAGNPPAASDIAKPAVPEPAQPVRVAQVPRTPVAALPSPAASPAPTVPSPQPATSPAGIPWRMPGDLPNLETPARPAEVVSRTPPSSPAPAASPQRQPSAAQRAVAYDARPTPQPMAVASLPPVQPPVGVQPAAVAEPTQHTARAVLYERAEAMARVGTDVILASDVTMGLDELRAKALEDLRSKTGGREPADQVEAIDKQLKAMVQKRLEHKIEIAIVCQHAMRTLPAENVTKIREAIGREFEKREVPEMMKKAGVASRRDLDEQMQAAGLSLDSRKQEFIDQVFAQEWMRQQVKPDDEISHAQMLAYYQAHLAEFERPPRSRWEQLTVRISKYPSRAEAYKALIDLGNQVLRGKPLAEVAKASSDGPTAGNGGARDWTGRGSLTSTVLERAIFGLPIGELSPVLEEENYLHIIRVVERDGGQRKPFLEAQVDIQEKIRKHRENDAREAYLIKLRQQIPVWTIFDSDAAMAKSGVQPGLIR